jgi:hypothetical protein
VVNARVAISLGTMLGLFMIVWALRFGADRPNTGLLLLELLGFAAGTLGAWLSRTRPVSGPMTEPLRLPVAAVSLRTASASAARPTETAEFATRSVAALRQSTVPLSVLMR